MTRVFLLSVLALTGALGAQLATHTVPNAAKTIPGAGASVLPLGRTRCKMQSWYRGDSLPSQARLGWIGWRVEFGLGRMTGGTHKIKIVLANTPVTYTAYSATYAANLGPTPTTFFALRNISFPNADYVHLDQPSLWVPGDAPFVFQGPHFIVQVDNQSTTTPTSRRHTVDQFKSLNTFTGNPISPYLSNCGGLLRPSYSSGFWTLSLSRAAPNSPVNFMVGGNHLAGSVPLPVDLGIIGLTGCRLDVGPLINLTGMTDANGIATLRFLYTHVNPEPIVLMAQALHLDVANPGLPAISNVTSTVFGLTGYCNEITSLNSFGPVAEFGPATANTATIVLLR